MQIARNIEELKAFQLERGFDSFQVGFVPTMGALHEGHLSLVKKSIADNEITVVSIFVNPTQFNEADDYQNYPRTEEADTALLAQLNPDLLFMPSAEEMYKERESVIEFDLDGLDQVMEGEFRKGHFNGVITIVNKLFELVQPNKAYFGLKDYQQLTIIKRFASVYFPALEIIPCPIIREKDGLAMSSRNRRLSTSERETSLLLSQVLVFLKQNWKTTSFHNILMEAKSMFQNSKAQLEYLEIVDANNLISQSDYSDKPLVACIAARIGKVRLIDNIMLP